MNGNSVRDNELQAIIHEAAKASFWQRLLKSCGKIGIASFTH